MLRFARPRTAAALLLCSVGFAAPATAQEPSVPSLRETVETAPPPIASEVSQFARTVERAHEQSRPGALIPLYISFGGLQVLDSHSTSRALAGGAAEANPVMKPFAGSTAGMLAVKAAGTAGVIYASEKMWKKNKTAAIIFMIATNSAMAWVVQNNYRAVR